MDEFDLSPEMAVEPLSIAPPQPKKPAQPQGGGLRDLGPIAALIPIALARGGRMGVAGLLQGYQRAQAQKQQQARLGQQDQRQASMDEQAAADRRARQENDRITRQQGLMREVNTALPNLDNEAAVNALLELVGPQAASAGIDRTRFEAYVRQQATPDKLTKRRVEKAVKGLNADTLQALMESQASLQDGDRLIPFAEWSQYVAHGVGADGKPIVKAPAPPKPDTATAGSFEEYVNLPPELQAQRIRQRKEYMQADDRPSAAEDPEIARLRKELLAAQVENAKRGPRSASGRPVLSSDANRIAEIDTSLDDVDALAGEIGKTGAASRVGAALPNVVTEMTGIGMDAKQRQAVIDRVKQVIGKALEGGVLRKEDEYKYTRILPTIGDPPQVAASKLQGLKRALQLRRQTTLDALGDAGYDTSRFLQRAGAEPVAPVSSHGSGQPTPKKRIGRFEVEVEP
jgi:hypothetical protein